MEQVTERSEPDTTVSSLAVTVTSGLGTEGERKRVQGFKVKKKTCHLLCTNTFVLLLLSLTTLICGMLIEAKQLY